MSADQAVAAKCRQQFLLTVRRPQVDKEDSALVPDERDIRGHVPYARGLAPGESLKQEFEAVHDAAAGAGVRPLLGGVSGYDNDMATRRHRNKHQDKSRPSGGAEQEKAVIGGSARAEESVKVSQSRDASLDAFFDPSRVRLSTVMRRQSELATLAWHFAIASIVVPVGGIVLGLLAVLFAREAQDMFDLVGSAAFDRQRAQRSLVIGGTMTAVWLIATIVLITVVASRTP